MHDITRQLLANGKPHDTVTVDMKNVPLLIFMLFSVHSIIDDISSLRIHVVEIIIGTVVSIVVQVLLHTITLWETIVGGVLGYGTFWIINRLLQGRLGHGDIWFSGFIGVAMGFWIWNRSILVGSFLGIMYSSIRRIFNTTYDVHATRIPFTPFMAIGVLLSTMYKGLCL